MLSNLRTLCGVLTRPTCVEDYLNSLICIANDDINAHKIVNVHTVMPRSHEQMGEPLRNDVHFTQSRWAV